MLARAHLSSARTLTSPGWLHAKPASHGKHAETSCPPAAARYVPAGQSVGAAAAVPHQAAGGQSWQVVELVAPSTLLEVPAAQAVGAVAPTPAHVPAGAVTAVALPAGA